MNIDEPDVVTRNLVLAATLVTVGFTPTTVGMDENDEMLFKFKKTRRLRCIVKRYWKDKIRISGRQFYDNMNSLRKTAYSTKFENEIY